MITSVCCLTAAFAEWTGSEANASEAVAILGEDEVPAEVADSMRAAIAASRADLVGVSDNDLLHAIGLYLAQLRKGGYHVAFGDGSGNDKAN